MSRKLFGRKGKKKEDEVREEVSELESELDSIDEEEDLELEAKKIQKKSKENEYKGTKPKKIEKVSNIVFVGIATVILVVGGLFVFRNPIREFIGVGSGALGEYDISGGVKEYKDDVTSTLKKEDVKEALEEEEEEKAKEKERQEKADELAADDETNLDVIGEGLYVAGVDINAGIYVAENVLVEKYTNQQDYKDRKKPNYTNVSRVKDQSIFNIGTGEVVNIESGNIVLNDSRDEVIVNLGDTMMLKGESQVAVGKDLPEGFYKLYNTNVLESEGRAQVKPVRIQVLRGDRERDYEVERRSVVFFQRGMLLSVRGDVILERIASDGSGGNHKELLEGLGEELEEQEKEKETEE